MGSKNHKIINEMEKWKMEKLKNGNANECQALEDSFKESEI